MALTPQPKPTPTAPPAPAPDDDTAAPTSGKPTPVHKVPTLPKSQFHTTTEVPTIDYKPLEMPSTKVTIEHCLEEMARVLGELAEHQEDPVWVSTHIELATSWQNAAQMLLNHQLAGHQAQGDIQLKQQQLVQQHEAHQQQLSQQDQKHAQDMKQKDEQHEIDKKQKDDHHKVNLDQAKQQSTLTLQQQKEKHQNQLQQMRQRASQSTTSTSTKKSGGK